MKRKPTIIIHVWDGMVRVARQPKGIKVIIRDFDVEEEDAGTKKNKSGKLYNEEVYDS